MNIEIFGTDVCPKCKTVCKFLEEKGLDFSYKTVGKDISKDELEAIVSRIIKQVPVIVVDDAEVNFEYLKNIFNQDIEDDTFDNFDL